MGWDGVLSSFVLFLCSQWNFVSRVQVRSYPIHPDVTISAASYPWFSWARKMMQAEKLAAEEAIRTGLYGVGTSDRSAVGGLLLLVKYLGLLWILVGGLEHFFPNSWNDDPIFHIFHKGLKPPTRIVWDFLGKLRVCTSVNYCFFLLSTSPDPGLRVHGSCWGYFLGWSYCISKCDLEQEDRNCGPVNVTHEEHSNK